MARRDVGERMLHSVNPVELQAGPLRLLFVPAEGAVRWIHAGAHEVLRGINAPVRDRGWGTVPAQLEDLQLERNEHAFHVTFVMRCRAGEIDFRWRGELNGKPDGTLQFTFDGEALTDFARNRIGFCVLHPASASGARCVIEHVDGAAEAARFPVEIQPHQPAGEIRAIRHEVAPGLQAEVRMEGDTFEMEDQRNWTDASFKTYCTPLAWPAPVSLVCGTRIRQRVMLRLEGGVPPAPASFAPPWMPGREVTVTLEPVDRVRVFPALGVIWNALAATDEIMSALRPLALDHLRVDFAAADEQSHERLRSGAAAAARLGIALELAVWLDGKAHDSLERVLGELRRLSPVPRVARWIVLDGARGCPDSGLIAVVRAMVAGAGFAAPVGGGAAENFTELNRDRRVALAGDFTAHGCNPQVHAADDASLFETLPIQGMTVAAARRLSGDRPACVSPVTFTRRWRRTDPGCLAFVGLPGCAPFQRDTRFGGPIAAAWTLGSFASLHGAGAQSVTYHDVVGPNGILSDDGRLRPVGAVFAALAARPRDAQATGGSKIENAVATVVVPLGSGQRVVMANLQAVSRRVRIAGLPGDRSIEFAPYGIVTTDVVGREG